MNKIDGKDPSAEALTLEELRRLNPIYDKTSGASGAESVRSFFVRLNRLRSKSLVDDLGNSQNAGDFLSSVEALLAERDALLMALEAIDHTTANALAELRASSERAPTAIRAQAAVVLRDYVQSCARAAIAEGEGHMSPKWIVEHSALDRAVSSHTPGPWIALRMPGFSPDVPEEFQIGQIGGAKLFVAGVTAKDGAVELDPRQVADAYLIEVAPDMFETLEALLTLHDANSHGAVDETWWAAARLLVKKGRSGR